MNPMVTRCPKCGTAFRITSTQLESAKGAVRCGSCLNIFKAQDHLVKHENPASKAATPEAITNNAVAAQIVQAPETTKPKSIPATKAGTATLAATNPPAASEVKATPAPNLEPPKPVIDKQKVLADEDDVLISDDMDQPEKDNHYEFDGFVEINMQPKQTVSLFEREIRYEPEEELEQTDESWAESLLEDDDSPEVLKKITPPAEIAKTPAEPPEEPHHYEAPLFSLVSDHNEQEQAFSEEFLQATGFGEQPPKATEASDAFAAALFEEQPDSRQEPEPQQQSGKKPVKSTKIRAFDSSRAALLMNIIPAPVEFTSRRMRSWYQRRLWPSLALLMALLLVAQIAYFKFDYFSRIEPFRTGYALACPVFNCKVQEQIDVSQIGINNLIVRSHPTAENALIVDAILVNNAAFEQPFPDLVLAFSTIDETPVASRRFTPKEYLAGELAGMKRIPHKQPVHITLELADPGPDAPNYHLSIP